MNKTSLSSSVIWYGVGNIFVRSVGFFLLPLYSNLISAAEFGNYSLLMSVYAVTLVVYQLGMFNAMSKFFIEENSDIKRKLIFSSILNSIIITGILLTLLLWPVSSEISYVIFSTHDFSSLLMLVFVSVFLDTVNAYILYLLKTMELAKKAVTYTAFGALLNLGLNILFVYYLRLSVAGIIYAQLISVFVLCLALLILIKENYVFRIDKVIMKAVIRFSLPLLLANIFTAGNNVADRFILNIFAGREQVGIYSFSYRIAIIMSIYVLSFYAAWNPHSLNLYYYEDYKNSFGKTLNKLVASCLVLLLIVSLFIKYLFQIHISGFYLFNPAFQSGIIIIPIVMTGYIFNGISLFYTVYPSVSNKTFHILIANVSAFALNLGLNIFLIPRFGMIGAAFATLAGFIFAAAYLFAVSRKSIKIEYRLKDLVIIILGGSLSLLAGLALQNFIINIALVVSYLAILWVFTDLKTGRKFILP
jgi:O-antigen/teichoic acid export membrane protein